MRGEGGGLGGRGERERCPSISGFLPDAFTTAFSVERPRAALSIHSTDDYTDDEDAAVVVVVVVISSAPTTALSVG